MAFGCWTSLIRFLLLCRTAKSAFVPDGVYRTECRDRYFMTVVDLSFAGQEPYFEAVDRTGVFPITELYAAQCGYSVSILPVLGIVELRASYFSCHTTNQNDHIFTFNFNLITKLSKGGLSYAFNKTCSPSLPWSPREVTCEVNYLEVSVKNDGMCRLGPVPESWDSSMQMFYGSATPGWQVVFVNEATEMKPLNLSEAGLNGYAFTVTETRLVFRAAYGQPHSFRTVIDGISVEVAHVILFSRQEWLVLLVDLIASCTIHDSPYDGSGYMTWETSVTLYPGLLTSNFSFGLGGELLEPSVAQTMGYSVTNDTTVRIGVPYNAEGTYRKSVVTDDLYDLYKCHFYMEQISTSDGGTETRTRTFRKLSSSPLKRFLLTENRSVPDENMFMVYLSNVPGDLDLVAIKLNEKEFKAPFVNSSSYSLDIAAFPNNTYGYTLTVPFDNPFIIKRFLAEKAATEYELNIAYRVMIRPKTGPYSYHTKVTASKAVSPPHFNASCSKSGITFELDHQPSDYLWDIIVTSDPLTSELASKQGYILRNNSQTLHLEVPLFTRGYLYEHITLEGFLGTFETYVRDRKTSEVLSSSVKTCPFTANDIIVCSKDGKMTVVADMSAVESGGSPMDTNLLDEYCAPIDSDETRALFSFPLNSCGTKVEIKNWNAIYKNEILFSMNSSARIGSILVQCTYPLAAIHHLLSTFKFESETAGVGQIMYPLPSVFSRGPQSTVKPTVKPTIKQIVKQTVRPIVKPTSKSTTVRTWKPLAYKRPVQYVKVLKFL